MRQPHTEEPFLSKRPRLRSIRGRRAIVGRGIARIAPLCKPKELKTARRASCRVVSCPPSQNNIRGKCGNYSCQLSAGSRKRARVKRPVRAARTAFIYQRVFPINRCSSPEEHGKTRELPIVAEVRRVDNENGYFECSDRLITVVGN